MTCSTIPSSNPMRAYYLLAFAVSGLMALTLGACESAEDSPAVLDGAMPIDDLEGATPREGVERIGTDSGCLVDDDCQSDEQCADGACQVIGGPEGCTSDSDCAEGQTCKEGVCEASVTDATACTVDADCADGERCVAGACEAAPDAPDCTTDNDCEEGQVCIEGACQTAGDDGVCSTDADCGEGEKCEEEHCVPEEESSGCAEDSDCPKDESCVAGVCQSDEPETQCVISGCSGEICAAEPMMSTCDWEPWYQCLQYSECGLYGTDGGCGWLQSDLYLQCLEDLENAECVSDEECEDGKCVDGQCQDSGPTGGCLVSGCFDEVCADAAFITADCEKEAQEDWFACLSETSCGPFGQDGACGWAETEAFEECMLEYEDEGCTVDKDCKSDELCDLSDCPPAISASGEALACEGVCKPKKPEGKELCASDEECDLGLTCNAAELCLPPPDCEPGEVCDAVCYGYCMPDEPDKGCSMDVDCDEGQKCLLSACPACICDKEDPDCLCNQECPGICVDDGSDSSGACESDEGCKPEQVCDLSDCEEVEVCEQADGPQGADSAEVCTTSCVGVCVVKDVDDGSCDGIDCGDYGTCEAGICVCKDDYSGENCDIAPADPCDGVDCGDYGSCESGTCVCTNDYTGENCDVPPSGDCVGVDCGAYGVCEYDVCVCTDGYTGELCDIAPADPCDGVDCGDYGSCESGTCVCTDDYTGENCDIAPIDPCDGVDCGDYGSCESGTCICKDDYIGEICEIAPLPSTMCEDDNDCSSGESCQCFSDPSCPSCDVCLMYCAPDPNAGDEVCELDSDCDGGMICDLSACEACECDDGSSAGDNSKAMPPPPCNCEPCEGICIEDPNTVDESCLSDSDCDGDMVCDLSACEDCECDPTMGGNNSIIAPPCECEPCEGVCVEPPPDDGKACEVSTDCDTGFYCDTSACEDCECDSATNDGSNSVPVWDPDPPCECEPCQGVCALEETTSKNCYFNADCDGEQLCLPPDAMSMVSYVPPEEMDPMPPQEGMCVAATGEGCQRGGCSGTLCLAVGDDVMSTCEWMPEYACYAEAPCGPYGPDGACGWVETQDYVNCVSEASKLDPFGIE